VVLSATLAFKMIGKLITRRRTAVKECSEDAHLKLMAAVVDAALFATKMAITKFVRKLIRMAPITDQYRIAAHGFIALFIEILEGSEGSDDRVEVIRLLTFFCQAGYPLQSGANHFLEQIADLRGIELLMNLQVNEQDVERTAVEHLLEALRIVVDDYEDTAPGSDRRELRYELQIALSQQ
jgi:hypothetical protein